LGRAQTWHLSATSTTRRWTVCGDSYTYLCCRHSVRMNLQSERASAVSPEIAMPTCSSTLKIFFWYDDMSLVERLSAVRTACVLERTPTHADPCFTASIAYST